MAAQDDALFCRNRIAVTEAIYRVSMLLDSSDFAGFMAQCDETFHYRITAFSPEIRKEMTWLEHDHAGMQLLFKNLPKHNSDKSLLTRYPTVYTVAINDDATIADVASGLQVFRTSLDGGETGLFAVGKMYDKITLDADGQRGPRLLDRHIKLDTRMFGIGFHIPF